MSKKLSKINQKRYKVATVRHVALLHCLIALLYVNCVNNIFSAITTNELNGACPVPMAINQGIVLGRI